MLCSVMFLFVHVVIISDCGLFIIIYAAYIIGYIVLCNNYNGHKLSFYKHGK